MTAMKLELARKYVETLQLPKARILRAEEKALFTTEPLEAGKDQAAVVGSAIASFPAAISSDGRRDTANSLLLAQLAAKKAVPDMRNLSDWYGEYFGVLARIGWAVQESQFAEYKQTSENFAAHEAILDVATTLLGPAPAALALVKTTIGALRSMDRSSPWMTLFDRETQAAASGRFQVAVVEAEKSGEIVVSLMAFALEAKAQITQVLFFKAKSSEATLRHFAGRVGADADVLAGVRPVLREKLVDYAREFIRTLPGLG